MLARRSANVPRPKRPKGPKGTGGECPQAFCWCVALGTPTILFCSETIYAQEAGS